MCKAPRTQYEAGARPTHPLPSSWRPQPTSPCPRTPAAHSAGSLQVRLTGVLSAVTVSMPRSTTTPTLRHPPPGRLRRSVESRVMLCCHALHGTRASHRKMYMHWLGLGPAAAHAVCRRAGPESSAPGARRARDDQRERGWDRGQRERQDVVLPAQLVRQARNGRADQRAGAG